MSEEKIKKKLNCQFFILVGPDSSTSEDSSTIEYSASALSVIQNEDLAGYGNIKHLMACFRVAQLNYIFANCQK